MMTLIILYWILTKAVAPTFIWVAYWILFSGHLIRTISEFLNISLKVLKNK